MLKLGEEYHSTWNMLATMSERAPVISSSFNVLAVGETLSDVEEIDVDLFDDVAAPPPATAFPKPDQVCEFCHACVPVCHSSSLSV